MAQCKMIVLLTTMTGLDAARGQNRIAGMWLVKISQVGRDLVSRQSLAKDYHQQSNEGCDLFSTTRSATRDCALEFEFQGQRDIDPRRR